MKKFIDENWQWLIIVLVSGFFLISGLGKELFIDWDECLYSVYPQEMKKSGNYLINQWNGYQDMQKPPLYSWLLQLPFLLNSPEFYTRLLSVLAGISLLSAVYFFSKKYFSKTTGLLAILFLTSTNIFLFYSQKLNTDIFFSFFIFIGFWLWIVSDENKRNVYFSGLMFALAVMIKGLSVVTFLIAIFISLFLDLKKKRFVDFIVLALTIFLLILPWHLITYFKYKEAFVKIYFLENLFQRSQYPIEFHYGGKFFYLSQLWQQLSLWLFLGLIIPLDFILRFRKKMIKNNQIIFLIILFITISLFLMTKIKTKIAWYLLPVYPFIAIYLAYNLDYLFKKINVSFLKTFIFLILILSAFLSLKKNTFLLSAPPSVSYRHQAALAAKNLPYTNLYYLVPESERVAKALLDQSPNLQISSTFIYGGNPCMVYYSQKKVHYYYSKEEFINQLNSKHKLFFISNKDLNILDKFPVKKLYQNNEFTLFTLI
jgi:4-amino-4-deoxy-L-arabinose transferase-like glycosyltransferase